LSTVPKVDAMELVFAVVLAFSAAVFVAWPFFRPASRVEVGEVQLTPLERQKREAYAAIKEAELDHQMGKLTDDDFAALRARYTQQALQAIAAIEQARARAATPIDKAHGGKPRRIAFCPSCGRNLPARANFCPGCGHSLKPLNEAVA
jgi:hypothetical protein